MWETENEYFKLFVQVVLKPLTKNYWTSTQLEDVHSEKENTDTTQKNFVQWLNILIL